MSEDGPKKKTAKAKGPIGPPILPPSEPAPEDKKAAESEEAKTFNRQDRSIKLGYLRLRNERAKLRNERLRIENSQRTWDNRMRLCAAAGIFIVVLLWLVSVLVLIALQGCPWVAKLSDAALIAMLATTSLNVIGLLRIVAVYLFPKPS